jgi:hypothetical protein
MPSAARRWRTVRRMGVGAAVVELAAVEATEAIEATEATEATKVAQAIEATADGRVAGIVLRETRAGTPDATQTGMPGVIGRIAAAIGTVTGTATGDGAVADDAARAPPENRAPRPPSVPRRVPPRRSDRSTIASADRVDGAAVADRATAVADRATPPERTEPCTDRSNASTSWASGASA